jgi:hypothetical protein
MSGLLLSILLTFRRNVSTRVFSWRPWRPSPVGDAARWQKPLAEKAVRFSIILPKFYLNFATLKHTLYNP